MSKPVLLWFDCAPTFRMPELQAQCAQHFTVMRSSHPADAARDIERANARVLCFDFDYPDQAGLEAMQSLKREHMHLPVLMLTLEHSEALAVWAFRSRVWNYLVKPVSATEMQDNLQALLQIARAEQRTSRAVTLPKSRVPPEIPARRADDPQALLLPAVFYLESHIDQRISAGALAKLCGLSRFQFSRLFHATFGVTFQSYLLRYRIAEACRRLERPGATVSEVCYAVGFNDPSHFSRTFKRYAGMQPSEYLAMRQHAEPVRTHPSIELWSPASAASAARRVLGGPLPALADSLLESA